MEMLDQLNEQLKTLGLRITDKRLAILKIFTKSKQPLTVPQILEKLEKSEIKANKTTIYRELNVLMENKIIEEVRISSQISSYELALSHHHHLICKECNAITDVEMENDLLSIEKNILKNKKFKVLNHSLEFFGLCQDCNR